MEKIVNIVYDTFFTESDFIEVDCYLVKIGMIAFLSTLFTAILSLTVACVLNNCNDSILFIVFFAPIRSLFKGYHCKTLMGCATTFTISLQLNIFFLNYLDIKYIRVLCIFLIGLIIYLYKQEIMQDKRMKNIIILYIVLIVFVSTQFISFVFLGLVNIIVLKVMCVREQNNT
ncbi:MAG: accessory gene regulator B family protein [Bacilli bacterium]